MSGVFVFFVDGNQISMVPASKRAKSPLKTAWSDFSSGFNEFCRNPDLSYCVKCYYVDRELNFHEGKVSISSSEYVFMGSKNFLVLRSDSPIRLAMSGRS